MSPKKIEQKEINGMLLSTVLCTSVVLASNAVAEDPYTRAAKLVAQMTLEEKLQFIQGAGKQQQQQQQQQSSEFSSSTGEKGRVQ